MADRKISDLTALTTPATGDLLPIVDVSEAAAADKNKSITIQELFKGVPDGTAAAPGLAFESDDGNGIYKPGTDQVAISTGGSGRLFVDASGNVGVGTSSPGTKFEVNAGHIRLSTNYRIGIGGTGASPNDAFVKFATNELQFFTNNSQKAAIDSSGRLLVGTSDSNAGEHKLQIQGNANSTASNGGIAIRRGQTNPASNEWLGQISFTDAAGSEGAYINGEVDGSNWAASDYPTRLTFATTADGASSPTERMRIDSSGRVGVGTTSPSEKLHLADSGAYSKIRIAGNSATAYTEIYGDNVGNLILGADPGNAGSSSTMRFTVDGTERLRIDSSGRVGIGISSPSDVFHVEGTIRTSSSTNSAQFANNFLRASASGTFFFDQSTVGQSFQYRVSNASANDTTALTITSAGNVGIGVTSPQAPLVVYNSAASMRFQNSTTGATATDGLFVGLNAGNGDTAYLWNYENDDLIFGTNNSERARIDSSGRLLVGTSSGTESVHVNGAIASVGTSSSFSSGAKRAFFDYNGGANRARIGVTSGANNAAQAISFHTSPSGSAPGSIERFRIGEVGQLGIGGATYGTSGQVLTSNGSSSAPSWQDAGGGGGKVLQVVQTLKTNTTSTSSTSYADISGMSVTITPSSTSSKILILATPIIGVDYQVHVRLLRGSTTIILGDSDGSRARVTYGLYGGGDYDGNDYHGVAPRPIAFLDSPSTTSATTYKLQWKVAYSSYPCYLNRSKQDSNDFTYSRGASTIIAMEIGA